MLGKHDGRGKSFFFSRLDQFKRKFLVRPLFEDGKVNVETKSVFKANAQRSLMPRIMAWLADTTTQVWGDVEIELNEKKVHKDYKDKRVFFEVVLKFKGKFEDEKCPSIQRVDRLVDMWWLDNWEKDFGKNVVYTITEFEHKSTPCKVGVKWTYKHNISFRVLFLPRGWINNQSLEDIVENNSGESTFSIRSEDKSVHVVTHLVSDLNKIQHALEEAHGLVDKCMNHISKPNEKEVWFRWERK